MTKRKPAHKAGPVTIVVPATPSEHLTALVGAMQAAEVVETTPTPEAPVTLLADDGSLYDMAQATTPEAPATAGTLALVEGEEARRVEAARKTALLPPAGVVLNAAVDACYVNHNLPRSLVAKGNGLLGDPRGLASNGQALAVKGRTYPATTLFVPSGTGYTRGKDHNLAWAIKAADAMHRHGGITVAQWLALDVGMHTIKAHIQRAWFVPKD